MLIVADDLIWDEPDDAGSHVHVNKDGLGQRIKLSLRRDDLQTIVELLCQGRQMLFGAANRLICSRLTSLLMAPADSVMRRTQTILNSTKPALIQIKIVRRESESAFWVVAPALADSLYNANFTSARWMKLLSAKIASLAFFRVMLQFSVYSELRKSFWAWGRVTIRPSGVIFLSLSYEKSPRGGNSINSRLKSRGKQKLRNYRIFIFQYFCWARRFINRAFRLKTFMEISLVLNPRHKHHRAALGRFHRSSRTDERNLIKLKLIDDSRVEWGTRLSQRCMQSTERSRAKWLLP